MLRIKDLHFSYGLRQEPVLRGISLEIRPGTYVAVIGNNGSGKTTFLRHLNGLLTPTSGSVLVDGLSTLESRHLRRIRQKVGMVFQNPDNQIVGMTVEEDVAFGPGNLGLPPAEIRRRVGRALEWVGMEALAHVQPHALSGGEKRLLAIAGVLAMEPTCVAFDEPTAFLDPVGRRKVLEVLRSLKERGITIIHVSHDMDEIVEAERILVFAGGRILLDGDPAGVFSEADQLRSMGLGIPAVAELFRRLRVLGVDVPGDILTQEDACRVITSFLATGRVEAAETSPPDRSATGESG